jgi:hypothetical protein
MDNAMGRTASDEAFFNRYGNHACSCWLDQGHDGEAVLGLPCWADDLVRTVMKEALKVLLECGR